ncbi:MAG: SPASM domain-containing protein [Magnetococcales bacterium]|nr:SPASM domain-containing protein [Magnetococcales bacterium]
MTMPFPKQVRIENTNHCNAQCIMCPREQLSRQKGIMTLPFFRSICDQLVAGGTREIHLQGFGEPFLDKSLLAKVRYAKEAGIAYTFMVTNASLIRPELARELLDSGLDKIKISFYGRDEDEYERVHLGLNYRQVLDNIRQLLALKRQLRRKKPVISLKYIGALRHFPRFLGQWIWRTSVSYAPLHNYGYGREYNRPRTARKNRTCPMVTNPIMQLLWTGEVVPCCYDFDGKIILGDLSRQTVAEAWNGEPYARFREIHRRREYEKIPICFHCDKLR